MLTVLAAASVLSTSAHTLAPELVAVGAIESVETTNHGWPFGGMSGIDRAPDGSFRIICDDRAKLAPARIASARISREGGTLTIGAITWAALLDERLARFPKNTVDAEDVRVLDDGSWVWSSEGRVKDNVPPAVYLVDAMGAIRSVDIPELYIQDSDDEDTQTRGVRHNRGFEAIADFEDTFLVAPEMPLTQDEASGITRLQLFERSGAAVTPTTQLAYAYGPNRFGFTPGPKNGIASMLILGDHSLLVLERGEPGGDDDSYDIRLMIADFEDAMDVTGIDDLSDLGPDAYGKKRIVLDFEDIRDQLPNGRVPNFEGMCLAPELGGLLLIADNDHGEDGPTILALIELPQLGIK